MFLHFKQLSWRRVGRVVRAYFLKASLIAAASVIFLVSTDQAAYNFLQMLSFLPFMSFLTVPAMRVLALLFALSTVIFGWYRVFRKRPPVLVHGFVVTIRHKGVTVVSTVAGMQRHS